MSSLLNIIESTISLLEDSKTSEDNTKQSQIITSDSETSTTLNIPSLRLKYNYSKNVSDTLNFPKLLNNNILLTCNNQKPNHIPIWLHRQAGRYMSIFRKLRLKYDFFTICKTPELICDVTLQPINKYKLDAAIIFSDILIIPPLFGFKCIMIKGKGPTFNIKLNEENYIKMFKNIKYDNNIINKLITNNLDYIYKGITLTRHALEGKVPLIGFCGDAFTLLSYIIEGGGSKNHLLTKKLLIKHPNICHNVLKIFSIAISYHLINQIKYGAQLIEIFGSLHGILSPKMYKVFVMPYLKMVYDMVTENVGKSVPIILFSRECNVSLKELSDIGFNILAIGWGKDAKVARNEVKNAVLQGNFDPMNMFKDKNGIKQDIYEMLDEFKIREYDRKGLIVNLGHGMLPDMSEESVEYLIDSVREYEKEYFS